MPCGQLPAVDNAQLISGHAHLLSRQRLTLCIGPVDCTLVQLGEIPQAKTGVSRVLSVRPAP